MPILQFCVMHEALTIHGTSISVSLEFCFDSLDTQYIL